jgi:putative spermidine/putrescine transport system permease protein
MKKRKNPLLLWVILILGMIYFFLPLYATFDFSLRALKDQLSFEAYRIIFSDSEFYTNFGYSLMWSALTIFFSLLLVVPTVYWMNLRLPKWRPYVEFITLFPFVVPAVVLIFGLIRLYSPFNLLGNPILLIGVYIVLSLPFMYRSVDAGLRAIDVRTLTEAAQSLGASWSITLLKVIFPNLRVSLLSGVFLTFAITIGEFTVASLLSWPSFGVYIRYLGAMRAYEPAALSLISFSLTWGTMGLIQWVARGAPGQQPQVTGAR